MKIRILQCDPVDPQAEDQVHRIRHQTGDLVIEYIQLVDAARRPEKWIKLFSVPQPLSIRSWPSLFPNRSWS